MSSIILTGFMGVGKSSVGQLLASGLGRSFVDADIFFAEQTGLAPTFYIRRFGIKSFRKQEKHFLRLILASPPGVLSTGGGVVLESCNRHLLLSRGVVVWLYAPLPLILVRLNKKILRPMIPRPFSLTRLKALYEVREPFYRKCHFKILNAFATPKEVAIQVADRYKEFIDHAPRPFE